MGKLEPDVLQLTEIISDGSLMAYLKKNDHTVDDDVLLKSVN